MGRSASWKPGRTTCPPVVRRSPCSLRSARIRLTLDPTGKRHKCIRWSTLRRTSPCSPERLSRGLSISTALLQRVVGEVFPADHSVVTLLSEAVPKTGPGRRGLRCGALCGNERSVIIGSGYGWMNVCVPGLEVLTVCFGHDALEDAKESELGRFCPIMRLRLRCGGLLHERLCWLRRHATVVLRVTADGQEW